MRTFEIERAVAAGNTFKKAVMELERERTGHSQTELEQSLTHLLTIFITAAGLQLTGTIVFQDVRPLTAQKVHLELAVVRVNGRLCEFSFPIRLLRRIDDSPGSLIFVAKCWVLLLVLAAALERGSDLVANFVFEIGDCGYMDEIAYSSKHPHSCLIVDYDFMASNAYASFRELYQNYEPRWEQRLPTVFWRGSSTGRRLYTAPGPGEPDPLTWLSRLALCRAVSLSEVAEHCDVGISSIVQIPEPHLRSRIENSGLMKPAVPRKDFNKYRYCFDIDGNANAWSGLFLSLLGGCCVLKVASLDGFRLWFYEDLTPWLHYVPVASDLSDLAARVLWCTQHRAHTEQIAMRGRELAFSITAEDALERSASNLLKWIAARALGKSPNHVLS